MTDRQKTSRVPIRDVHLRRATAPFSKKAFVAVPI
ncbi:hypothetical protein FHT92_002791 [Rhizobium sp. BK377]|nr:hypothetical protein [Rhizobium sp. BK377]